MKNNIYKKIFRSIFLIVFFVFININTANAENSLSGNIIEKIENTILPSGTITYSTTEETSSNVITTLHLKNGERILNNNGNNKYTFTENGSFTFKYLNVNNEVNEVKAEVNNIVKAGENGDLQGQGYEDIHISSVTGRQFKEYRQNIDGWESKYPITHLSGVWSSGWRSECGSVSIITMCSGYTEKATFADLTRKLESTDGNTNIDGWVSSYTGQSIDWSYSYSKSTIANRLANGEVAILHSTSSLVSNSGTHFMTLLDINEDKSKVYLSNPWMGSNYQGWITFDQLSAIFNQIGFIENIGTKPKYIDSGENDDTDIKEDKIFFIGDSWMEILKYDGVAKSPSSYFYAKGSMNADWVLNTYSSMNIPDDASCIVVEFGLNGLTNWAKTQELANKLANDYKDKKIFILQTPHICSGYTVDTNFNSKVDTYNEKMKQFCSDKDRIIFINPTTNIVSDNGQGYLKDEYAMDPSDTSMGGGKIHLNSEGDEIWYNDIVKCIKETSSAETQLAEIKIKQAPSKTEYTEGENFSTSGMKVEAVYSDGTKKEITNYTVKNGNNLKAGQTSVTISYTEGEVTKTVDQKITVNNKNSLTEIKIITEPTKKAYIEGESFSSSGMKVEAVYSNGSKKEITDYKITNGNNLQLNQTSVTISYTEGGVTKTAEQAITVSKKETLKVESRTYEITEESGTKYIEKVISDTSIKKFKEQIITNGVIKIYNNNQEITNEDSLIATGMEIRVTANNTEEKYVAVVTGDLLGKGKKDGVNLLKLARFNAKIDLDLKGAYLRAADIYKDGKYGDIKDILKLSRELANLE